MARAILELRNSLYISVSRKSIADTTNTNEGIAVVIRARPTCLTATDKIPSVSAVCKRTIVRSATYGDTHQHGVIRFMIPYMLNQEDTDTCQCHVDSGFQFHSMIVNKDMLTDSGKEGIKKDGSDRVSSAIVTNPVSKQFNSQSEVQCEKVATSSLNFQDQHLSKVTKEVKRKNVVSGFRVQDVEKQKVNNASSFHT
ncbi:OLC1v1031312C1 [Oldenlandia corymbosa var. corymbosa]|uniref:OLC1v1031312C1 n=1 Tax=Oldenlandia corymbosa var. corymbosa TaxID=529605 RepID=A0AAV1CJT9_OLDCO|nr:OLC1v1031312C1 [Oldenlandia corymbosa var. corymbosa]